MFFAGISDEAGNGIAQQIAAHKELGWKHLELRGIDGKNLTDVDDATFAQVVEAVEAAGMQVCSFASQLANWSRKITNDFAVDREEMERAVPRMQRLGTRFIRCMSYPNDNFSDVEWRDEAVRRLKVLARMAEDGGVLLLHENCNGWGGESPENSLELLERVDSPAFKLVFDTGNPFMHRQNAVEYLRKVIDHVVHVHIKDGYLNEQGKETFTYPDEGSCRVGECLRILIEHGYDAGYSIEPHVAQIIHTGEGTGKDMEQVKYESYCTYGRKLMTVYERAAAAAKK
ncbi:MAG TPA: sugar phosphate isomerase/epimerase family protein [Armatimonadota bacterium]|nr:sugar phosphate isomerase/epimerase family protein [Armatimonadota bacterium]